MKVVSSILAFLIGIIVLFFIVWGVVEGIAWIRTHESVCREHKVVKNTKKDSDGNWITVFEDDQIEVYSENYGIGHEVCVGYDWKEKAR